MIDPVTLAASIETFKARANTSRRASPRSTLDAVTVPGSPSSRSPLGTAVTSSAYWDGVSERIAGGYYHDAIVGGLKRDAHLRLIQRWCGDLAGARVLKTDLFEEAHGPDQFLFDLVTSRLRLGIDISPLIARSAERGHRPGVSPPTSWPSPSRPMRSTSSCPTRRSITSPTSASSTPPSASSTACSSRGAS